MAGRGRRPICREITLFDAIRRSHSDEPAIDAASSGASGSATPAQRSPSRPRGARGRGLRWPVASDRVRGDGRRFGGPLCRIQTASTDGLTGWLSDLVGGRHSETSAGWRRHSDVDGLSLICMLRVVRSNASRRAPRGDEQPRWRRRGTRGGQLAPAVRRRQSSTRPRSGHPASKLRYLGNDQCRCEDGSWPGRSRKHAWRPRVFPAVAAGTKGRGRKNWKLSSPIDSASRLIRIVIVGDPRDKSSASSSSHLRHQPHSNLVPFSPQEL